MFYRQQKGEPKGLKTRRTVVGLGAGLAEARRKMKKGKLKRKRE